MCNFDSLPDDDRCALAELALTEVAAFYAHGYERLASSQRVYLADQIPSWDELTVDQQVAFVPEDRLWHSYVFQCVMLYLYVSVIWFPNFDLFIER